MTNQRILSYAVLAGSLSRRGQVSVTPPVTPPATGNLNPNIWAGSAPVGTASYPLPTTGGIYVDSARGVDTAAGTLAAPVKTFEKAHALVAVNGTIVLRGGTYHEGKVGTSTVYSGIPVTKAGVTIQNYPEETVWFDGSSVVTGWVEDTAAVAGATVWRKDGWTLKLDRSPTFSFGAADSTTPGWNFVDTVNYPCAAWPDQVFFNGNQLDQVNALSKVTTGKFFVDQTNSKLYVGSDPTGVEVRASDLQTTVSLGAAGCKLRGIGFRRYAPSMPHIGAVKVYRSDCTVENVVIEHSSTIGISCQTGVNIKLNNVTANNCGNMGVHTNNADDMLLYRVRAELNNREHFNYAPASGGIKITRQRRVKMQECVVSNNYGKGLWLDESVYDMKIVSCNFNDNEQRGVVVELCGNLVFANNQVCNNGYDGLVVFNVSPSVEIWNNTIVGNGRLSAVRTAFKNARNLTFYSDERQPMLSNSVGRDARYAFPDPDGMTWTITQSVVKNNVIAKVTGQAVLAVEDYNKNTGTARSWTAYGLSWDGNFYNWVTAPQYPWLVPNAGSAGETVMSTLTAVRSTLSQEANSTLVTGSDALNPDYSLLASHGAAHNKALPLPAAIATLVGKPADTRYVGAWR